jgi:two-component sensor histidine kinase
VGRNCRFLQGERTDPDHLAALREGIEVGREVAVDILNYRADGTSFRNRLLVTPVHDAMGQVTYFLGIQKELTPEDARRSGAVPADEALREIQHRVKNHLAMIVGLIRIQSRQTLGARDHFDTLARRVESLQLLYEELSFAGAAQAGETISLGAYLGAHLQRHRPPRRAAGHPRQHRHGRPRGLRRDGRADRADPVGGGHQRARARLRGPPGRPPRRAPPAWDGRGVRIEVRDDGVGIAPGVRWPDMESMGGRIVAGLVDGLAARLLVDSGPGGTTVTLDVPDARAQGEER